MTQVSASRAERELLLAACDAHDGDALALKVDRGTHRLA
jgi:hypothetical protein